MERSSIQKDGDLTASEIVHKLRETQIILRSLIDGSYISRTEGEKIIHKIQELKDPHFPRMEKEMEMILS